MVRFAALAILTFALSVGTAQAQWVIVNSPPPPVVWQSPPVVVYSSPVVSYSPPVTYAAPVTYSYYPPTTVYSAPAVVTPVIPGTVTTRRFVGYGIFRPRGVYTQSYFTPW